VPSSIAHNNSSVRRGEPRSGGPDRRRNERGPARAATRPPGRQADPEPRAPHRTVRSSPWQAAQGQSLTTRPHPGFAHSPPHAGCRRQVRPRQTSRPALQGQRTAGSVPAPAFRRKKQGPDQAGPLKGRLPSRAAMRRRSSARSVRLSGRIAVLCSGLSPDQFPGRLSGRLPRGLGTVYPIALDFVLSLFL
jgi:hypothetical protein